MTTYQYRVSYAHEGIPTHHRDFMREESARRLVAFLERSPEHDGWDLHYLCDHESTECRVGGEWRYKDPPLTHLSLKRRVVGDWEVAPVLGGDDG
jgi:hypothetical protein